MDAVKIMIVKDSANVAEDARECLESLGYEVPAILASGEAAVETAGKLRPDAVLMDITLAGRHGRLRGGGANSRGIRHPRPVPVGL